MGLSAEHNDIECNAARYVLKVVRFSTKFAYFTRSSS